MYLEARCIFGVVSTALAHWNAPSSSGSGCNKLRPWLGRRGSQVRVPKENSLGLFGPQLIDNEQVDSEARVIAWIQDLVKESLPSLDLNELGLQQTRIEDLSFSQLGAIVLYIWSYVFAQNLMWPLIQCVSKALQILAKRAIIEIATQNR